MAKVIKVEHDGATIVKNDGELIKVPMSEFSFRPAVHDEVEVFDDNGKYIINKLTFVNDNIDTSGKKVSKVAYIVLAILLGCVGVHKFYAGKIGVGVVFVIFCWTGIPALIGFIEGLVAIGKKADADGNIYL
ncbi:TM2 domain-containing protein [Brochothrix campestris]|uniref:TM2 domain-containing protein n=2 Tax=Brochothrix campestris TaxID=2757 RepID=W7CM23_9LIST|nr:TM2 domain-containing protein [Brochothrix campestris]EUJ34158.1 hypothetical protein BCAMP_12663 [Brochothrix campestris FSL F6-1037]